MTRIDGLLFDKDGTLFDFQATWASWAQVFLGDLARGDGAVKAKLAAAIGFDIHGNSFARSSVVVAGTPDDIAERLLPHLPGTNPATLINLMNVTAASAPQAEAASLMPVLTQLREDGVKLGVATNDAEAPARAHLASAGISQMFDFISGFDSGYGSKPHPGPCLAFCEQMRISPAHAAMVGDSRHDLLAGRAAGMTTIAVLTGLAVREDLAPLADFILDDVSQIPSWLSAQNAEEFTAA